VAAERSLGGFGKFQVVKIETAAQVLDLLNHNRVEIPPRNDAPRSRRVYHRVRYVGLRLQLRTFRVSARCGKHGARGL
jgi:hypothetical protein